MTHIPPRRRALLSVSDKTGILPLAKALHDAGFEIVSTGGTQKALEEAGFFVTHIEKITQFPECFGGRVKTMHPLVMGGVLFKRDDEAHVYEAGTFGITPIDIVVVNLYPFQETMLSLTEQEKVETSFSPRVIEQIDIGGPTLLRSAAKNHASVTVLCDPNDYPEAIAMLKEEKSTTLEFRKRCARKVFEHTAHYDACIAEYLSDGESVSIGLQNGTALRYGENPHQWGKFFATQPASKSWKQLQGKELSYLNLFDGDSAWRLVSEFSDPSAVFVKHANPCGVAERETIEEAFQVAYDCDKLSAFGVIIAINRPCTEEIARKIVEQKIFVEVLLAPSFEQKAREILAEKVNLRLIEMDALSKNDAILYRSVPSFSGLIVQQDDSKILTEADLTPVTSMKPTAAQIKDLLFAWKVVKHTKSNAIVLAKDQKILGIGAGQTSRVDAVWIAAKRAGEQKEGAVLASDAFFPFPDSIEEAAKHGISAIIQPGGSVRDSEVYKRAEELGIVMVVTGVRAFRH
jgi:phosphoribosylaminoimidazolecarboxamide formyltransferase/IMP cyclohydrolase